MPNPFNPLDWLKSAQDWFAKSERSSGFRPYLIYLLLSYGMGISLLSFFSQRPLVTEVALALIVFSSIAFILLYSVKSHKDPDFCRSETHIQRLKKIEIEVLGTELKQVSADFIEGQVLSDTTRPAHLTAPGTRGGK